MVAAIQPRMRPPLVLAPRDGTPRDQVVCGDALEEMARLPSASVDLICVDPPYFRVKSEQWDRQWDNATAFLAWLARCADEWARLLKPNGSLYVFASPQMAARVEVLLGERLHVLNRIRWLKSHGWHRKARPEDLRSYLSPWEEIIFAELPGADSMALGESGYAAQCERLHGFVFEPLRAYLDGERRRAGIGKPTCNAACGFARIAGGMASRHYFSQSQWCLPTQTHYHALQRLFNERGRKPAPPFADFHPAGSPFARLHERVQLIEYLRADYEELRADYEELRADYEELRADYEELRRPFHVTKDVPYTDVWDFPTVAPYPGKHPCEKPQALLRHILDASTRPGALVLDCFAGTGSLALAARAAGRHFIAIEREERYVAQMRARLAAPTAGAEERARAAARPPVSSAPRRSRPRTLPPAAPLTLWTEPPLAPAANG